MPYLFIILLLGLMACTSDQVKTSSEENLNTLNQSIDRFNQAFAEGDVISLSSMITADYKHTNGTSPSIGRDAWLGYLTKRAKQIESGELAVEDYRMEEREAAIYGNTAILTARVIVKSNRNGQTEENEYRVTNIWVLEDSDWKRAGFHDGKIK